MDACGMSSVRKVADVRACTSCKRRFVCAYDGSEHSERALKWFFDTLHHEGDHVYVYHAFEWPAMPPTTFSYGFGYFEEWEHLRRDVEDEVGQMLLECRERIEGLFKPGECKHIDIIKEGGTKAEEGICRLTRDIKADLVIAGSRGQGTVRRTILGSVSDYIVHHAHVPVAVIPPPYPAQTNTSYEQTFAGQLKQE